MGRELAVYPGEVIGDVGVDAWPTGLCTPVSPAGDACKRANVVRSFVS